MTKLNIFGWEVCREGSGMIGHGKKIGVNIFVIVLAGSSEANRLVQQIAKPLHCHGDSFFLLLCTLLSW